MMTTGCVRLCGEMNELVGISIRFSFFVTANHDAHLIFIIDRTITPNFLVLSCFDSIVYQFSYCVLDIIKVDYYVLE